MKMSKSKPHENKIAKNDKKPRKETAHWNGNQQAYAAAFTPVFVALIKPWLQMLSDVGATVGSTAVHTNNQQVNPHTKMHITGKS